MGLWGGVSGALCRYGEVEYGVLSRYGVRLSVDACARAEVELFDCTLVGGPPYPFLFPFPSSFCVTYASVWWV